jgi:hypothetical protein
MSHSVKSKSLLPKAPVRKSPLSASAAGRRSYPAWIDAAEPIASFPATLVHARVRDGLVLRPVVKSAKPRQVTPLQVKPLTAKPVKTAKSKLLPDGDRAR